MNLVGTKVFGIIGDHNNQLDGIIETEDARLDNMFERIRRGAA